MKNNSYGLKEVADVYFFKTSDVLNANDIVGQVQVGIKDNKLTVTVGDKYLIKDDKAYSSADKAAADTAGAITYVYGFDSLKVSNIELTSEETTANGGKGNPELISWSYGKAATLTIEEALINLDTFHLIFGTKEGNEYRTATDTITIDANSFPDAYFAVGTTVIRSFATGNDEPFVFVVPKAKPNVSGTLTMQAEGDPSTFEMTLKCLAQEIATSTDTSDKDVLLRFYKPAKTIDTIIYPATIVKTNTTTGVDVTIPGVTASTELKHEGAITPTAGDGKVTIKCKENATAGTAKVTGDGFVITVTITEA